MGSPSCGFRASTPVTWLNVTEVKGNPVSTLMMSMLYAPHWLVNVVSTPSMLKMNVSLKGNYEVGKLSRSRSSEPRIGAESVFGISPKLIVVNSHGLVIVTWKLAESAHLGKAMQDLNRYVNVSMWVKRFVPSTVILFVVKLQSVVG